MDEKILRDLYERMGRMEAKIDDIRQIRETAETAYRLAEKAYEKANDNEKDIQNVEKNIQNVSENFKTDLRNLTNTLKWTAGTILTILVPLTIFILGQVFK
jgi:methyl-accepting chemotaxis protein